MEFIPLALFLVALVGAPIAMSRKALSASHGCEEADIGIGREVLYRTPVRAQWNSRRFGPTVIYEVVVTPGNIGVAIRHDMEKLSRWFATRLYPSWWFVPADVQVTGELETTDKEQIRLHFSYEQEQGGQSLRIETPYAADVVAAAREAGFSIQ